MNHRIMMIDYAGGHIWFAGQRGQVYGRPELSDLMNTIRDAGFDTVWFRTSFLGTVCYPSKVMKPFDGEYRLCISDPLKRAMAQFDPLEVAIDQAHRCGLKILVWITPMDNFYPACDEPVLARHPEWLLRSRDGQHAMRGLPCFAYQGYTDIRVAEVREVMGYGCDGVYHSWATHTGCTVVDGDQADIENNFGWNPPILERYHQLHGEPSTPDDYDYNLIAEIHADAMDGFVEQCSQAVHDAGGEYVSVNTSGVLTTDEHSYYCYRPNGAKVFRLPAHWRQWIDRGWIDRMVATADGPWLDVNEQVAPLDVPMICLLHAAWTHDLAHPEMRVPDQEFEARVTRCLNEPFGSLCVQESDTIEAHAPHLWAVFRRLISNGERQAAQPSEAIPPYPES